MNSHFIKQPSLNALLRDIGTAHYIDILFARSGLRLFDSALNTICNKGELCPTLRHILQCIFTNYKGRHSTERMSAAPTVDDIIRPSTDYNCSRSILEFGKDFTVGPGRTVTRNAIGAVTPDPLMQFLHTVIAHR